MSPTAFRFARACRPLATALGAAALLALAPVAGPWGRGDGSAAAQTQFGGDEQRDLARISNYLNGTTTLQGAFVQVGPDGDVSTGAFFLRRPGRVRFEYDLPNPTLIVADGTWVGVIDRRARTLDRFPLSRTPLDLLLSDRVDLRTAGAVTAIERGGGRIRVTAIDPDAADQGSISMIFSDAPLQLIQWVVVDAQGLTTTVALSDIRANVAIDGGMFFIEDPSGG
ncbi:MAG: outer membrane lipoprotein carrier protein LolA [Pseudomonadota bacterium]